MTFKQAELDRFVWRGGGKSAPPVFVGRNDILSSIEAAAFETWKPDERKHGEPGVTRVIHGAPGAGKTSILRHLEHTLYERENLDRIVPGIVRTSSVDMEDNLSGVLKQIMVAGHLKRDDWIERGRDLLERVRRNVQDVDLFGYSLNIPDHRIGSIADIQETMGHARWARPVILAVDEAQNLPPDKHTDISRVFRTLHEGESGAPISLVCAGLGDTMSVLNACGLTRALTTHHLGGLHPCEQSELLHAFCDHFAIICSGCDDTLEMIIRPTEGWPHHMHFALKEIGQLALTFAGDLTQARKEDWISAANKAEKLRKDYYEKQQSPLMKKYKVVVAEVLQSIPGSDTTVDGADGGQILKTITSSFETRYGEMLSDTLSDEMFRTHLVHQGALQESGSDLYYCPIPSFRRYLVQAGGLDPDVRPSPVG
ncbi:MAG: ATP-binding protein [Aestuariivita sp.]|nr:ATP-binding protein [Aestuariivita sp.]